MSTKRKSVFRQTVMIVAALVGWVGLALLVTRSLHPPLPPAMARQIPATTQAQFASPALPEIVGNAPSEVTTPTSNAFAVPVPPRELPNNPMPTRDYRAEPGGTIWVEPSSSSLRTRPSLDLIDFRYQPDIRLDDLK